MLTDDPPRRPRRASALAAILAACSIVAVAPVLGVPQDGLENRIRAAWSLAAVGSLDTARQEADEVLGDLGRRGDPAVRDAALVLRAVCRYDAGERGRAAGDLRDAGEPLAVIDAEWMPSGAVPEEFIRWAEESGLLGSFDGSTLPDVSLEELNPEEVVNEVSSNFVMDVEIVRIPVIVENTSGEFLSGLQADQFEVVDGTPPAQPVYQLISDDEPTSLGLLIDAGDAVGEHQALVREAVVRLLGDLRGEDEVFVVSFADEAAFLSDFRNVAEIQDAVEAEASPTETETEPGKTTAGGLLEGYSPGGDRALFDAVALGLIRMRTARYDKKALIVLSAGDDIGSETSEADLARAAQREGVAINTLLLAPQLTRWRPGGDVAGPSAFLQRLAHQTGGLVALRPAVEARFGGLEGWIELAIGDLSDYIEHQYLLLFESYDPPPPGEWRELGVRVDAVYERVRARSGYVR